MIVYAEDDVENFNQSKLHINPKSILIVSSRTHKTQYNDTRNSVINQCGEYRRNSVQGYHRSPSPNHLGKGAKSSDISTLKSAEKRNLIDLGNGDYDSRFTIGFEIEKTRFSRGAVRHSSLFAGFERDSSCGYEAITHILPLLPSGMWRNKVLQHDVRSEAHSSKIAIHHLI